MTGTHQDALDGAALAAPRHDQVAADGVLPDGVRPLGELPSRVPVEPLRAPARRDVFWSGDWIDRGNPVSWTSRDQLLREARYFDPDAVRAPEWPSGLPVEPERAEQYLGQKALRTERLATLGVLDQWRTATSDQVAAFVGTTRQTVMRRAVASALASAGLVDYGVPVAELSRSRRLRARHLPVFRPAGPKRFDRLIAPTVSYGELVAITGGLPFSGTRQMDRHNLLATELGLRAAEYVDRVGAVVGEKLSRADLLFPGLGVSQAAGDLTIVRDDGLRIVVELTASVSDRFRDKVARWARLLDRYSLDSSGVVVLFVEAAKPNGARRGPSILAQVVKQVSMAAAAHPGVAGTSVADRMFVASWTEMFPGKHLAAEDFPRLPAACPTGPSTGGGNLSRRWERRDLADPDQVRLDAADGAALRAAVVTSGMLAGSPFWLRSGADIGVWNRQLELAGIDRIPQRPPQTSVQRPDGTWGPPEVPPPAPGTLSGLGGRHAVPRLASRGLPVVPLGSTLVRGKVENPQTGRPAWDRWDPDAAAQ